MRVLLLALQLALIGVAFTSDSLSAATYLYLYFADFVIVTTYFVRVSGGVNWVLDKGYVLISIYTIYYPLTAFFIVWNDLDGILPEFVEAQARMSVLFIGSFVFAYVGTLGTKISRSETTTSAGPIRHYSNWVLIPLIFLPYVLKLAIVWFTTGVTFEYGDVYTASFDLEAAGFNLVNQALNVFSSVSLVALILFFAAEVRLRRARYVALVLGALLLDSVYLGARTIFLAAALTLIVVYGGYFQIRLTIRNSILLLSLLVFFFGVEANRASPDPEAADTGFVLAEPFMIFSNARVFVGAGTDAATRPEINSYVNDVIKIVPNYVYSTHFDISRWYVQEFYPGAYEKGLGLAFGFNTEAFMNGGEIAAICQALVVGLLFALVGRAALGGRVGNEVLQIVGVELVVGAYAVVRVTTFSFLAIVGPTLVALLAIRAINVLVVAGRPRVHVTSRPAVS